MYGFLAGLAADDVHLRLYTDLLEPPTKHDYSAILALDLQKAFDQVTHQAILRGFARISPGERAYNYVKAFLSNPTARYKLSDLQSSTYQISSIGTPQGSVLSPLFFNLAVSHLPPSSTVSLSCATV